MTEQERDRRMVEAEDEVDETVEPGPESAAMDEAAQQDFATRNVMMSNALPGGASPVAGAVIGSGGEMGMEPEAEEPGVEDRDADDALPLEQDRPERR